MDLGWQGGRPVSFRGCVALPQQTVANKSTNINNRLHRCRATRETKPMTFGQSAILKMVLLQWQLCPPFFPPSIFYTTLLKEHKCLLRHVVGSHMPEHLPHFRSPKSMSSSARENLVWSGFSTFLFTCLHFVFRRAYNWHSEHCGVVEDQFTVATSGFTNAKNLCF